MYQKKKKRLWLWLVLLLVMTAVAGGYVYYQKQMAAEETSEEEEIILGENQELCYVHIDKLLGNEMTGTIMEESGKETRETDTWTIPVGTDVVTKLGTTTTFVRLASGDTIKMLIQKMDDGSEEILKIWITDLTDQNVVGTDNEAPGDQNGNRNKDINGNANGSMEGGNGGFPGGK